MERVDAAVAQRDHRLVVGGDVDFMHGGDAAPCATAGRSGSPARRRDALIAIATSASLRPLGRRGAGAYVGKAVVIGAGKRSARGSGVAWGGVALVQFDLDLAPVSTRAGWRRSTAAVDSSRLVR